MEVCGNDGWISLGEAAAMVLADSWLARVVKENAGRSAGS
jgi:hypothetical protein